MLSSGKPSGERPAIRRDPRARRSCRARRLQHRHARGHRPRFGHRRRRCRLRERPLRAGGQPRLPAVSAIDVGSITARPVPMARPGRLAPYPWLEPSMGGTTERRAHQTTGWFKGLIFETWEGEDCCLFGRSTIPNLGVTWIWSNRARRGQPHRTLCSLGP